MRGCDHAWPQEAQPGLMPLADRPSLHCRARLPTTANLCSFQSAISKREDLCRTENQYLIFRITLTQHRLALEAGYGCSPPLKLGGHKKPAPAPSSGQLGEYNSGWGVWFTIIDFLMSCVCFFTTIHFKEALHRVQKRKLLRSHFWETFCNAQKVLREIGLNSLSLCKAGQSTHCAKNTDKKPHTRGSCLLSERGAV